MTKESKWFAGTLGATVCVLILVIAYIAATDPFFHYHKPLEGLSYTLYYERYQNDGIVKHFDYDTIITGTSMTANFKTTDCDRIFGGKSVKVPFHGASFKEINDNLEQALKANPQIRTVIRCLDTNNFTQDKDHMDYEGIPYYLYDDSLLNDTEYVLNKNVLIRANEMIQNTLNGKPSDTFDDYGNWQDEYEFGREAVLATYDRPPAADDYQPRMTEDEKTRIEANIKQNITDLADRYPNVTFYYYLSPYSIAFWDSEVDRLGKTKWQCKLQDKIIREILPHRNIRLFSFDDRFDLITNLDNYKDRIHYSADVNTQILQWMHEGTGLLTEENYEDYIERIKDFYRHYDYDSLYE